MENLIINKLGDKGNLVAFSKSNYRSKHPNNIVVFNSNIIIDNKKCWFGDIDVTISKDKLLELSKELNNTIYILYEMDARFEHEEKPNIENFVIKFFPNGTYELHKRLKEYYNM